MTPVGLLATKVVLTVGSGWAAGRGRFAGMTASPESDWLNTYWHPGFGGFGGTFDKLGAFVAPLLFAAFLAGVLSFLVGLIMGGAHGAESRRDHHSASIGRALMVGGVVTVVIVGLSLPILLGVIKVVM